LKCAKFLNLFQKRTELAVLLTYIGTIVVAYSKEYEVGRHLEEENGKLEIFQTTNKIALIYENCKGELLHNLINETPLSIQEFLWISAA